LRIGKSTPDLPYKIVVFLERFFIELINDVFELCTHDGGNQEYLRLPSLFISFSRLIHSRNNSQQIEPQYCDISYIVRGIIEQ
jgi:hypothetical protein